MASTLSTRRGLSVPSEGGIRATERCLCWSDPHHRPVMANVTVVYYSSTGHSWQIARAVEEGASAAGAQTRLRKVRELASPEAIAAKPGWQEHLDATRDVPEATLADLEWA